MVGHLFLLTDNLVALRHHYPNFATPHSVHDVPAWTVKFVLLGYAKTITFLEAGLPVAVSEHVRVGR